MMPVMRFVGNIGYVMVALLGGYMTIKGSIEVGNIQSFFQYLYETSRSLYSRIAQVTNMMQSAAAASERVFEFLEEEEGISRWKIL